jgi:hypothetical protein
MRRRALIILFLIVNYSLLSAQVVLTIEGTEVNDTETGTSFGVNIARSQRTIFSYLNNSITSVSAAGYLLQAGDENPGDYNNNLDGEIITGNKFIWNGTDVSSWTHALFTGYNIDVIIKYNYLKNTPNGIQRKSDGMTDNSGVIAYNILNNPKLGVAVKGINGIRVYNNTFYSEYTPAQTNRGLVDIHANTDNGLNVISTGTKVFNNIFYTRNRVINIKINETACLEGFESDYNIFWCEAGEPIFEIEGLSKTFTQWQSLGYDLHSVVLNPNFNNFSDFVPLLRLDYGKDLGVELKEGLAIDATWGKTDPGTVSQNGTWQVGARIAKSSDEEIKIYYNADLKQLFVEIADIELPYQTIKIHDLTGNIVLIKPVEHNVTIIPIPESFTTGIYIIVLESGSLDSYRKKVFILG